MSVFLAPIGNDAPYVDTSGNPFSGALLSVFLAGSATPATTYTTSAGSVQNANPMSLNAGGYPTTSGVQTQIWLTGGASYLFILKNSGGTTIWSRDNISGIGDTTLTVSEWQASGFTPTFVSATSFTVPGDQTTTLAPGRRVKSTNSGGTIYSTILTSTFAALTTVTVVNDSGVLDSGLSSVSVGLMTSTNPSTPLLSDALPVVSGSSDRTKKLRFEVDGFTTATTRVLTPPNFDGTIATLAGIETLTNKTLTTPVISTPSISNGVIGTAVATQTQQEAGTDTAVLVTSGRQHFHASAAKGWAKVNVNGTTAAAYNVTSITDSGPGQFTVVWDIDFSSANYVAVATVFSSVGGSAATTLIAQVNAQAAGTVEIYTLRVSDGSGADASAATLVTAFGDQ